MNFFNQLFGVKPQALTIQEVFQGVSDSQKTQAGISVGVKDALSYAPVWQAVEMISGDMAKMRLNVYERQPELSDTARTIAKKHQAYKYVKKFANEKQSAFRFWQRFNFHNLLWNNAYAWIKRSPSNGKILGLYLLRPDRTGYKDGMYYSEIGFGPQAEVVAFKPSDILHFEGNSVPGVVEPSALKNARESWGVGLAAVNHAAKFFGGDCNAGGILEIPASFEKKAKDNLEQGFQKKYAGQAFQTVILRDGAKFHSIQIDAEKSQMDQTRTHQAREVAQWFNIPPSKLGIPDSGGYGSRAEDNRNYYDQTLSSRLCDIAGECELKLLTRVQRENDTHYFEHSTSALLAMDRKQQAEIFAIEAQNGAVSPDEYRASTNRNPRPDGKGNEFYQPNANFIPVESDDEDQAEETNEDVAMTARILIGERLCDWINAAVGVLKKEVNRKTPGKFAGFLQDFKSLDFDKYFSQGQALGMELHDKTYYQESLKASIDSAISGQPKEDWPQIVASKCDEVSASFKKEFTNV